MRDLQELQKSKVLVVGDVCLDEYIRGNVSRISPEAPVPVISEKSRSHVLGGAANVAANVAALGARCVLMGRVGQDDSAEILKGLCSSLSIEFHPIVEKSVPTIRKTRVLAGYQQLLRVDKEMIVPLATDEYVLKVFKKFLDETGPKSLVISDYGKGFLNAELLEKLISGARAQNISVVTDPKSKDLKRYKGSSVLKPNLIEALEALGPKTVDLSDTKSMCVELSNTAQVDCVVLSLSERGVACYEKSANAFHQFPSVQLQVADVSGAGDTMIAVLAMSLASGWKLPDATRLANRAAGVVCGKMGTATLSMDELRAGRAQTFSPDEKILSVEEIQGELDARRSRGQRVVFTNGCFDILHAGHVQLLHQARQLGDCLVLGLNSDASVKRLKGTERPIQNEKDRAKVLAALESVSYVVVFEEDTPLELIEKVKPQLLVKGGDYNRSTIVGADLVESWGGEVRALPLLEGRSTTGIVNKAKDSKDSNSI
jgi:D-beta-D-heptose 7-phosphate kinase / D-beta-D-heptose 1-phosphate adenosyltransferase